MLKTFTKYVIAAVIVCIVAALLAAVRPTPPRGARADGTSDGILTVHFIDCGQADACVIEFPDGKTMLIDTGDDDSASRTAVENYIDALGITTFDYFIITHSDADHIGGVKTVFDGTRTAEVVYRPSQVAYNSKDSSYSDPALTETGSKGFPYETDGIAKNTMKDTATYRNALATCYSMTDAVYVINPADNATNSISGSVTVGGVTQEYTFEFYSPLDPPYSDSNNYSPIMVLNYAGRSIALSGDAEKKNEAEFAHKVMNTSSDDRYDVFRQGDFHADIIKMGHHGSNTSSSSDYLDIMTPNPELRLNTYTVFSCNDDGNNYAHPGYQTLQRIMDEDFSAERIARTDLMGDLRFDIGAKGELMYTEEKSDVGIADRLRSGTDESGKYYDIADNTADPTEANGSLPITPVNPGTPVNPEAPVDPGTDGGNPFLDFWNKLTTTQKIIAVAVVIAVIAAIVVIAVLVYKNSKKKRRNRSRR